MGRIGIIMALLAALVAPVPARAEAITQVGAAQIGDNTVKAIDHNLDRFDKTVTLFDTPENNALPANSESETVHRIRHKLANHHYWAVRYVPRDQREDHEISVFIDSTTGAILGIYMGK